jgi:methylated-DNA-[protein]-cysteine S-methyltransferase
MKLNYFLWKSPVGNIHLVSNQDKLLGVAFDANWLKVKKTLMKSGGISEFDLQMTPSIRQAVSELKEYFAGKRKKFSVPIHLAGTVFQVKAWRALQKIPFGQTRTYQEQAQRIGHAKAVRAVGAANGRNLLGIIVPCHRVIGASGHLTGYAGGMSAKQRLLEIEGAI